MSFYSSLFKAFGRPLRRLFAPVLRPVTRFLVGAIAIPVFRLILMKVFRLKEIDDELEKDLEQWFRGSLLLLAATANMEHLVFFWTGLGDTAATATGVVSATGGQHWFSVCLRLLLAIGVVEAMPDQELFAVIHPGPPPIRPHRGVLREIWKKKKLIAKGIVCQHLNRLSPVMAIMCAIFGGRYEADPTAWVVGWSCYGLAIFQYLIIGLVTSRDRALDVLSKFDRAVAKRRRDLIKDFDIKESVPTPKPKKIAWWKRRSWKRRRATRVDADPARAESGTMLNAGEPADAVDADGNPPPAAGTLPQTPETSANSSSALDDGQSVADGETLPDNR